MTVPAPLHDRIRHAAHLFHDGRDVEAELICRQVVAAAPAAAAAHLLLAEIRLGRGDDDAAWGHYEHRLRLPGLAEAVRHWDGVLPDWDGSALAGRRLLVHPEQGLGDIFMFSRWLPVVAALGKVSFVTYRPLASLMSAALGSGVTVLREDHPADLAGFDCQAWLCSLPSLTGRNPATLPPAPWLTADAGRVAAWRQILAGRGLAVGLVWSGNPGFARNGERALPAAQLAPILAVPGCRFFSLQLGAPAGQAEALPPDLRPLSLAEALTAPPPDNFVETAACLAALDVVITTDTAVANLAGALGVPAWVMVMHTPDFRWRRTGTTTPWLPSLRLFRQPKRGDWEAVVAEVAERLAERVGKRQRVEQ